MKGELFALPFWFIERNANIRRNTLSDCVFLGSRTFKYAPRRKAAPFASCLYLRVLTVDLFVLLSETRYKGASCALTGIPLARLHLSKVAAVNLPASDAICNPSPRFNVTGFAQDGRNAYLHRNTLSGLRFALFSCLPFWKGEVASMARRRG